MSFTGIRTARVYPEELPNVPAGTQQILLGRYLPEGKDQSGEIVVTGMLGGKPVRYSSRISFRDAEQGNSFIPRLWARMHLNKLLEQGPSETVKQEIIALSEEFNIITPDTSLLVLETEADRERFAVKRRVQMRDGFDSQRNALLSRSRRLELVSPTAWLGRTVPDGGRVTVSWCQDKEFGTTSMAFLLGRARSEVENSDELSLRGLHVHFLQQQGRCREMADYLGKWLERNPESDLPFGQFLLALVLSNKAAKAEALAAQWLRRAMVPVELPAPPRPGSMRPSAWRSARATTIRRA